MVILDIDSDSDSDEPTPKRAKDDTSMRTATLSRIEMEVDDVKEDIDNVKEDIMHLNDKAKIPMGLQRIIRDTFQCKICLRIPIRPPVGIAMLKIQNSPAVTTMNPSQ